MLNYIINLFQGISLLTIVLLGAGVLLCVVEAFVPKVGVIGLLGIGLTIGGISSYYIDGFKITQVVAISSIIAVIIAVFVLIALVLENKGVINNPNPYKFRTYCDDLNNLIGRMAKAVTNIDLAGTVDIDGKLYYAISKTRLPQGSFVHVLEVKNNTLIVG